MHTITITVKNKKVLPKIYSLLKQFQENDIIVTIVQDTQKKQKRKKEQKYSDEYIKKHWRKFVYKSAGDLSKSDDEILPDAYMEYLHDKSSF